MNAWAPSGQGGAGRLAASTLSADPLLHAWKQHKSPQFACARNASACAAPPQRPPPESMPEANSNPTVFPLMMTTMRPTDTLDLLPVRWGRRASRVGNRVVEAAHGSNFKAWWTSRGSAAACCTSVCPCTSYFSHFGRHACGWGSKGLLRRLSAGGFLGRNWKLTPLSFESYEGVSVSTERARDYDPFRQQVKRWEVPALFSHNISRGEQSLFHTCANTTISPQQSHQVPETQAHTPRTIVLLLNPRRVQTIPPYPINPMNPASYIAL